jgi:hypothetical protein
MSTGRLGVALVLLMAFAAQPTHAAPADGSALLPAQARDLWRVSWQGDSFAEPLVGRVWQVEWQTPAPVDLSAPPVAAESQEPPATRPRAKAFEYSDAYNVRRKIHMYASIATLPLVVTEWALGQKLYSGNFGETTRSAHQVVAASLGVLFGVNSVTGVWNLMEARKDPNHRTKRTVHGILMLAADAGFVATAMTAPSHEEWGDAYPSSRSTHRAVGITALSIATAGYVMMLFGR